MKRMSILVAISILAGLVAFANVAWAECTPENWKDCKGNRGSMGM